MSASTNDRRRSFVAGGAAQHVAVRPVVSPFDGTTVAEVEIAGPATLDAAAEAAVRAQRAMADLSREARSTILERTALGLEARAEIIARTIQRESGKPIRFARIEVARAADTLRASADAVRSLAGAEIPIDAAKPGATRIAFTRRFPVGPVAAITPFNFPLNLVAHKVGPAIAAGCPIVVKPASSTPLTALLLAEAVMEAGLPEGALAIVITDRGTGQRLVEDDRFRLLSFTGSAEVGWAMKRDAGKKRVVLELGGNAAAIVMDDADVDRAADRCAFGAFYQAGQSCISVQRILVHRAILARFRDALVDRTRATKTGDPSLGETIAGPLIDEGNARRVEAWLGEAVAEGGALLTGGAREGAVVTPAIVEGAPRTSKVMADEVFGPVACLAPVGSIDEAIAAASDTRFGLQCGIFTNDLRAVMRAWEGIEVGGLIHDDVPAFRVDLMPYGGVRDSGLGREGPRFAVEEMTEPRLLVIQR